MMIILVSIVLIAECSFLYATYQLTIKDKRKYMKQMLISLLVMIITYIVILIMELFLKII